MLYIVTFHKAPALLRPPEQPAYKGMLWEEVEEELPEIPSQSQADQRDRRLVKAVEYVQKYGFIPIAFTGN